MNFDPVAQYFLVLDYKRVSKNFLLSFNFTCETWNIVGTKMKPCGAICLFFILCLFFLDKACMQLMIGFEACYAIMLIVPFSSYTFCL